MNCNELRGTLEPLIDGEVDADVKCGMLQHINACTECQSVWAELQDLKKHLRAYQSIISTPQHLRAKILDMLLGHPPASNALKLVESGNSLRATPEKNACLATHDSASTTFDVDEQCKDGVGDFVDGTQAEAPEGSITSQLLHSDITEILSKLTHRERDLMRLRFGLDDGRPRTLEEVAVIYGVTRERVRQIEAKALGKLRSSSRIRAVRKFGD